MVSKKKCFFQSHFLEMKRKLFIKCISSKATMTFQFSLTCTATVGKNWRLAVFAEWSKIKALICESRRIITMVRLSIVDQYQNSSFRLESNRDRQNRLPCMPLSSFMSSSLSYGHDILRHHHPDLITRVWLHQYVIVKYNFEVTVKKQLR